MSPRENHVQRAGRVHLCNDPNVDRDAFELPRAVHDAARAIHGLEGERKLREVVCQGSVTLQERESKGNDKIPSRSTVWLSLILRGTQDVKSVSESGRTQSDR